VRCTEFVKLAAFVVLTAGSAAAHAGPTAQGPAAKLSNALGGTLDSEVGEAGALAHEIDYASVTLRPGRSLEYRRRVALDSRFATHPALARQPAGSGSGN